MSGQILNVAASGYLRNVSLHQEGNRMILHKSYKGMYEVQVLDLDAKTVKYESVLRTALPKYVTRAVYDPSTSRKVIMFLYNETEYTATLSVYADNHGHCEFMVKTVFDSSTFINSEDATRIRKEMQYAFKEFKSKFKGVGSYLPKLKAPDLLKNNMWFPTVHDDLPF